MISSNGNTYIYKNVYAKGELVSIDRFVIKGKELVDKFDTIYFDSASDLSRNLSLYYDYPDHYRSNYAVKKFFVKVQYPIYYKNFNMILNYISPEVYIPDVKYIPQEEPKIPINDVELSEVTTGNYTYYTYSIDYKKDVLVTFQKQLNEIVNKKVDLTREYKALNKLGPNHNGMLLGFFIKDGEVYELQRDFENVGFIRPHSIDQPIYKSNPNAAYLPYFVEFNPNVDVTVSEILNLRYPSEEKTEIYEETQPETENLTEWRKENTHKSKKTFKRRNK